MADPLARPGITALFLRRVSQTADFPSAVAKTATLAVVGPNASALIDIARRSYVQGRGRFF
jgi:hypothetical protein